MYTSRTKHAVNDNTSEVDYVEAISYDGINWCFYINGKKRHGDGSPVRERSVPVIQSIVDKMARGEDNVWD